MKKGSKPKTVKKVIRDMGAKYACHPSNHVQRLAQPLTDSAGTDVAATFKRIQAEREAVTDEAKSKVILMVAR